MDNNGELNYFAQSSDSKNGHICNCIGCCKVCGGCRTHPRHVTVCESIAKLNEERVRIWKEAGVYGD